MFTGCQSMSSRFRPPLEGVEATVDDDWEPPKVNSRYSQPQAYVRRERGSNPIATSVADSEKPKGALATGSAREKSSLGKEIAVTEEQELDIESAVAALPPNMQEAARRQLATIQSKASSGATVKQASAPADSKGDPKGTSSVKVSAKLSDSSMDDAVEQSASSPVRTASAEETTGLEDSVKTAFATGSVTDEPAVVTASAKVSKPISPVPTSWNGSLSEAIAGLEQQLEEGLEKDENLRLSHEMTLRMLYLAQRRLNDAVRPIEGLDTHEQDYLRHQAQALFEASNPDAMPIRSRRWSLVMNSQRQATNNLAAASNLEVRSLAFCNDVQGYGVMTKFPKYQFQPDQEVLLYCEVENVTAEQVKGGYETQLQGTYEILDATGKRVTDQLLPMEKEICQNHRRDYFIIYHIYMPARIEPGNYQMRVTIEDGKAKKFGQAELDFQIQP